MVVLIAFLALGVVYLAVKSPDVNTGPNTQDPGPNVNVPPIGAVGNPSPAMSGGSPVASQTYRTAMSVNAGLVGNDLRKVTANLSALASPLGTFRPPTQTVAEASKSLMTAVNPPQTTWQGRPPGDSSGGNTLRYQAGNNLIKI